MRNHRVSKDERFNKLDHYGKIINEYKVKRERTEGPRSIAIKMYEEGKTLEQILAVLGIFKEENIIEWLIEEFSREEIMEYYINCEKQKIIDKKQKEGVER